MLKRWVKQLKMIGYPFIYNGVPSEVFEMSIVFINNNNTEINSGSGVEMQTDSVFRNPEVLFMGARQAPVLEFPIEFVCEKPMDIYTYHEVKDWLFGGLEFKPLQICIDNLKTYYFNCKITAQKDYIYGDGYRGFSGNVVCDAPWAWEFPISKTFNSSDMPNEYNTIKIFNLSADKEDVKPIVRFTLAQNSYSFSMRNQSYENYLFEFTNLLSGEEIEVDNKSGIISSSTGLRRLKNLTKGKNSGFFKLKRGLNTLSCTGKIEKLEIIYQNAIRLGGGFY